MRLQNIIFSLLLDVLALCVTSCGERSSHQDDLNYYTTIALQMKDVVPKVQIFFREMLQGVQTAKQVQSQTLDKESLDKLKRSLTAIIDELDTKIKTIDSLKETDIELHFKGEVLLYLTETKQLQETSIPKVLELLESGLDKITNEQKEALTNLSLKAQELQTKSAEIEKLSLEYQKKHKITNEELMKYGL